MFIDLSQSELKDLKNIIEEAFEDQDNYKKYGNPEDDMSAEDLDDYHAMLKRWEKLYDKIVESIAT